MIGLGLSYFVVGIAVVASELARKPLVPIDALRITTVFLVVSYLLVPIFLSLGAVVYVNPFYFGGIKYFGSWYAPLLVALGYMWLRAGHWLGARCVPARTVQLRLAVSDGVIVVLLYVALAFVVGSIALYVAQFGGIRSAIIQAELIRNGVIEGGALEFVKHFFRLNGVCLGYTFYRVFLADRSAARGQFALLFGFSLALFVLLVFLWNGRGFVVFSVLTLYFIAANAKRHFYPARLAALGVAGLAFFFFGNYLFVAAPVLLEHGFGAFVDAFDEKAQSAMNRVGASLVQGFVHPIASLEVALQRIVDPRHFRYFMDIPLGALHLIPQRLLGVSLPDTVSYLNTMMHQGIWKSVIPPGVLALGVYSLGAAGVPLIMFLYGALCGAFDRAGATVLSQVPGAVALYVLFAFEIGSFAVNGDPRRFFYSSFMLVACIVVMSVFARIRYNSQSRDSTSEPTSIT